MLLFTVATFVIVTDFVAPLSLPSYIKACRKSDPDFEKCAIDSATKSLPTIVKGDRKLGLIRTSPLIVPEIKLKSSNMVLTLKNLTIQGLERSIFHELKLDFDNMKGKIVTTVDKTIYDGDYEVDGHILVFPIKGSGRAHIEMIGGRYEYHADLEITNKNGVDYLKLTNAKATYTLTKSVYKFDNLFGGDERLGKELNKVLNENWESVNNDLSGSVGQSNADICVAIANSIITKVPLKEIILDW